MSNLIESEQPIEEKTAEYIIKENAIVTIRKLKKGKCYFNKCTFSDNFNDTFDIFFKQTLKKAIKRSKKNNLCLNIWKNIITSEINACMDIYNEDGMQDDHHMCFHINEIGCALRIVIDQYIKTYKI